MQWADRSLMRWRRAHQLRRHEAVPDIRRGISLEEANDDEEMRVVEALDDGTIRHYGDSEEVEGASTQRSTILEYRDNVESRTYVTPAPTVIAKESATPVTVTASLLPGGKLVPTHDNTRDRETHAERGSEGAPCIWD